MDSVEPALIACRRELAEALEQQAATGAILRVIARSPTEVQPVFETIAQTALRLCEASIVNMLTFDGELLHVGALAGLEPQGEAAARAVFPRPPGRDTVGGMAVLTRDVFVIEDVLTDERYWFKSGADWGLRSALGLPLLRDGQPIGALAICRPRPGPFDARLVALLRTFADQAVIAIENARLFDETQRALARQTATAEVLRVISGSITDTQPVFDVIAERAARLTGAKSGWVFTFDGEWIREGSSFGLTSEGLAAARALFPMRPGGASYTARAIRDGCVMNVADALAETDPEYATKPVARLAGYRSVLSVPMFKGRQVLGAISVNRAEVGRFDDKEVELLRTFADQAVIAIENTRLSNEREARNRELAEALEQQTATSDLLRAIGRSMVDLQPVFETLIESAVKLCGAKRGFISRFDGKVMRFVVGCNVSPTLQAFFEQNPFPPNRNSNAGRAAFERRTIHNVDVMADPEYTYGGLKVDPYRTVLAIPMIKEDAVLGVIVIYRHEVQPFTERQIALVQTFADQAVIALENTRLFRELQDKTRELEIANRHKSAFLANMSHELRTPLNAVLGFTRIVLRETRAQIAPKQAENLEKILASARHLVGLINATLDLTRIEAGRIEITPSEVALAPLLDECLRSVEPLCVEGVRLDARVADDLPTLRVDAEKLHQILLNLLGNAVKFTDAGRIELRAAARDGCIVIEVEDSGIGIPPGKLEAVFEEFEQVDASHTRAHGGTGLGLAIARRLARAMDGDLGAVSTLGVGSTFTLTLPLRWKEPGET